MNTTNLEASKPSQDLPKTTECMSCHSILITRGVAPGQQARCGRCGNLFRFGNVDKVATNRLAWRSFWLGLSSMVFLFLTGVPAVYYGIRSLLRMRFVRPKKADRVAAVVGTVMGGCFGIFLGFFVAIVGIIIGLAFLTVEKSDVIEEVEARMARYVSVEYPEGVRGRQARTVLASQHFFNFNDMTEDEDPTFHLHFVHHDQALSFNRGNVAMALRGNRYPEEGKLDREQTRTYRWKIDGKEVDFKRQVYIADTNRTEDGAEQTSGEIEYHHFVGLTAREGGFYGFSLTVNVTARKMTDTDVQAFFESIKIVKKATNG